MLREDAIEDVIRQFSDPMAFLRELVQNALDAGSQEVEIAFDYQDGHGVISVLDWGEGMTRDIIETRLVRLFNSTKDDDFTKIGKFGIGFVSVFAMEPVIVCVDTGRDGEYWRILLHPDRSYELLALPHPVEGTQVDLHVEVGEERFEEIAAEAAEKVAAWCEFAPVPILIDGEDIRGTFDLEGLVVARFEEEGTRAVAALVESEGTGKFFNGGLALQTIPSEWAHISYLIDSRYLEHTLTRDQVLQNKKFHAAIDRLRELIEDQLTAEVIRSLRDWSANGQSRQKWHRLGAIAARRYDRAVLSNAKFPLVDGTWVGASDIRSARERNRLMLSHGKSPLADNMPDDYMVLDVPPNSGGHALLTAVTQKNTPVLEQVWVHPHPIQVKQDGAENLVREATAALNLLGSRPRWVGFGKFDYRESGIESRGLLVVPSRAEPIHRGDLPAFDFRNANGDIVLNAKHPIVSDAIDVAAREPEWAGYTLVKCAALAADAVETGQLDQETDANLALAMLNRREQRLAQ